MTSRSFYMPYKDPEKNKAYHKAYSAKHYTEHKGLYLARSKAWQVANREKKNAINRVYRLSAKAKELKRQREHDQRLAQRNMPIRIMTAEEMARF